MRLVSQLISAISRVLQKLLSCFNGTIISVFFCFMETCLTPDYLFKFQQNKPLSLLGSWMCQQYLNMFHLNIFIKNSTCFRIIIAIFYQIIINLFLYDRSLLLFQCFQCPSAFVLNVEGWFGVSSSRFIVLLPFDFLSSYYYININFELLHQFHCFLLVCNCP